MSKERKEQLQALWRIARICSQTYSLQEVFSEIAKEGVKALRGDASSIRLLREEGELELVVGYNLSQEYVTSIPLRVGEGLVGKSAQEKKTFFSDNVTEDPRILYPEVGKKEKIVSLVCTPLISKEKLLGTLTVYSRKEKTFTEEDKRFIEVLAEQASLTIERTKFLEGLKKRTISDDLTGLYSRSYFISRCRQELARASREKEVVSFLFSDVNNFKAINRIQGYKEGDRILCQVAKVIRSNVREEDVVCRYGGDEFAVLLLRANSHLAAKVARRVHRSLSSLSNKGKTNPTLSTGVVCYPEHASSLEDILSKADSSMIFAKCHPTQKVVVWGQWEKTDLEEVYTQDILPEVAYSLARVVDEKDGYTAEHSRLVAKNAALLARKMSLNKKRIDKIRIAGLLHDIGKLAIPAHILNKPGKLNEEEIGVVRGHPEAGERLLRHIRGFKDILPLIRATHERWDGEGYPDGLKGEQIPLGARIIAVVDVYIALSSDRPYRKKLSRKEAVEEIKRGAGSEYDPEVVEIFLSSLGRE